MNSDMYNISRYSNSFTFPNTGRSHQIGDQLLDSIPIDVKLYVVDGNSGRRETLTAKIVLQIMFHNYI